MKSAFLKYIFLFLITATVFSCDKNNGDSTSDAPALDDFLKSNTQLSMFSKALDKAGLETFKTGPGPFTWFAPSNDAFIAASITADSLNKMSPGQVNYLL